MSLQADVRAKLLTMLAPLTVAGGGTLKQIHSVSISSEEEVDEVLERFKDRVPGGFLSTPVATLARGQAGGQSVRTTDATFSYLFVAAFADRGDVAERLEQAEDAFDMFVEAMLLQRPTRSGLPTTAPLDFIDVSDSGIMDKPAMTVFFARFKVVIRNLQVNQPA